MFFTTLAGLRALFIYVLSFAYIAYARDLTLFTSSVTYCDPPEAILVQYFDIMYIANNHSVFFNISAESVETNLNVTANIMLNAYGMNPVNITIDFCSILGGVLCPLPKYHFKGSQTIQLPDTVDTSVIPGIAYYVPDLEAYAQLRLTETSTGDLKACVQATLSNGQSMKHAAVSWGTGVLTAIVFLLAIWESTRSSYAIIPVRLLDLMHMYQAIVASTFLNLNYSSAYRAFTLNFAWAFGFITSSGEQDSIDRMRALTGGGLANSSSSSAVEQINRKASPYNTPNSFVIVDTISSVSKSFISTFASADSIFGGGDSSSSDDSGDVNPYTVQTVTEENTLAAGFPVYSNSLHIGTANAFMTIFFTLLIIAAIYLFVVLGGFVLSTLQKRKTTDSLLDKVAAGWKQFVAAWGIRLLLVVCFPIFVLAFYQWTLKDSWLSILLSVIAFLVILGGLVYSWYRISRVAREQTPQMLHSDRHFLATFSPIYGRYHAERFYFAAVLVVAFLLKAIFIAAAKSSGAAQIGLYLAVEVISLIITLFVRPTLTRGGDIFISAFAIIRIVCVGLMISFLQSLNVGAIARTVIGIVLAVIYSVAILVIVVNIIVHVIGWFRKNTARSERWSDSSTIEKGEKGKRDLSHSDQASSSRMSSSRDEQHSPTSSTRPENPTPDQHVLLDPELNKPYPSVTPSSSGCSTTFGSLLPSRWSISFSPLQSTRPSPGSDTFTISPSQQSHSHSDNPAS